MNPPKSPPSASGKVTARGYNTGDAVGHPNAKTPAPSVGVIRGNPAIATPKAGPDRPVAPLDLSGNGIDRALRALKHVTPSGSVGGNTAGLTGQTAPKANGSGALPKKAK